ncbi:MAG: Hsp33 family molecular chaperone HslO [Pseudomonadota bacterium]|uniref:Hsp33 family molecular chaperone HslO n=1 Tax=Polaromonas sp. TaxID=1869339 RepID=UPI001830299A|nr:Hsp33 family molecular chaperone HslO [Polaromonas sp.]MBA3594823.1 Hsp33 family molecular chaperone HslO [Polaromonas sp.]MDQ3273432.1 Hsp33 family molecular chaperone HslO [Pseudomonadota bacterium]
MSELHKFIFDGLPVRGMLVRLTDAWQEILKRREAAGGYPSEVLQLLGEMTAAGALMQSNIKFNGALVLQIFGDGPLKLAVAEVQPDLSLRATATVTGEVLPGDSLSRLVNVNNQGRCAITLDPKDKLPGRQPYQGVVPLFGDKHEKIESLGEVLEHYMLQSEQLDTKLILAADGEVAAGLLIQRLPVKGQGNLQGQSSADANEDEIGLNEDYNRIAILASSLKREELLTLDADTLLHRLFWEEKMTRFVPSTPTFACSCSQERVSGMLRSLGTAEVESILAEQGRIDVGCEFCGAQYGFDPVDAAQIFTSPAGQLPPAPTVQ